MNKKTVEREHKVYELDKSAVVKLEIKKRSYRYNEMLEILTSGNTFFLEVDRRAAKYVRTQLEKMLGELLEATCCVYTTPDGEKLDGYVFNFKMVSDYLEKVHVEEGK